MADRMRSGGQEKSYAIRLTSVAEKALERLPNQVVERIAKRIDALRVDPRSRDCVKLTGSDNKYRVRVGTYRIVYRIQDDVLLVLILDVGHRKDVYRRRK